MSDEQNRIANEFNGSLDEAQKIGWAKFYADYGHVRIDGVLMKDAGKFVPSEAADAILDRLSHFGEADS